MKDSPINTKQWRQNKRSKINKKGEEKCLFEIAISTAIVCYFNIKNRVYSFHRSIANYSVNLNVRKNRDIITTAI